MGEERSEEAIRIEDRTDERARQQQALATLSGHALGGADLATVTELIATTLNVNFCTVLELLPGNHDGFILRAGMGWKDGLIGNVTIPAGINSQAGYTLLCGEPVVVEDLCTEQRFNAPLLLREHGIVCGITVVIGRSDRPFGVLGAHSSAPRIFTREDVHFLQIAANVLSQVIENKSALEEIQRKAFWIERLIETTQDAVVSIDRRGCIVLFNAAAERIFGYGADEIVGQKVNVLMAEPYAAEHDGYIARYEYTGEKHAIGRIRIVEGRRKNGEIFPIELSVAEIEVDHDVRYGAFIRDISEKIKLQSQLVESERFAAIGATAAKIGHELANPLNGMSLTVQLLEQRLKKLEGAENSLAPTVKRLKDEISRLQRLVGDFGTISRKEKYVFRPVDLIHLIRDMVELHTPLLSEKAIEICTDLAPDLPMINVDADKIKQALLNLLKNAVEAMPGGGSISISAVVADETIVVEMADNGEGIPLDIDAFEPFVTTKKDGTGVGLVVVRQILNAHEGKISYRSRPGAGTTFRLELPRRS